MLLICAVNRYVFPVQPFQRLLMRMAVGIIPPAGNNGIFRRHTIQKRLAGGCGASMVAAFQHIRRYITEALQDFLFRV